jgi:hypothetical protein
MIRVLNFILLAMTISICFGLYKITNETRAARADLSKVEGDIAAERDAITILRAEWSYLAQPSRLQELSGRHLELEAVGATQIGTIASIPFRKETRGVVVGEVWHEDPPAAPRRKRSTAKRTAG